MQSKMANAESTIQDSQYGDGDTKKTIENPVEVKMVFTQP